MCFNCVIDFLSVHYHSADVYTLLFISVHNMCVQCVLYVAAAGGVYIYTYIYTTTSTTTIRQSDDRKPEILTLFFSELGFE